jgi:hypothetical protein
MELSYLSDIGLKTVPLVKPLLLVGREVGSSDAGSQSERALDVQFPVSGKRTYVQRLFNLPFRDSSISDIDGLVSWADARARGTSLGEPTLQCKGLSLEDVDRLRQLAAACKGDVRQLGAKVHDIISNARLYFAKSVLGNSLMRGESLWSADKLRQIFRTAPLPRPNVICSSSKYGQLKWRKELDRRVVLSIDMREANFSSLRVMSQLVDPALHEGLKYGWLALLDSLFGSDAAHIKASKPLRELVLGGVERQWLRETQSLTGVVGLSESMLKLDGPTFLRRGMGDEGDTGEDCKDFRRVFKDVRGRFSRAFTEVERDIIEQIAAHIADKLHLQVLAINGDEVVFVLPVEAEAVAEVDATARAVWDALRDVFTDGHSDIRNFFRIESFLIHDLSQVLDAPQHGSLLAMTRRLLPTLSTETFSAIKGNVDADSLGKTLRALRDQRRSDWESWLV